MNPETVTTSQLIGSFTAKHWSATFVILGTFASCCFWVGQRVTEFQCFAQQADLKTNNGQIQAKLEVMQAQNQIASITTAQIKELLKRAQRTIEEKSNEVGKLTEVLGRSNNCAFVQQQIIDTKKELDGTGSMVVFDASQEWQEKQKVREITLEQRLNGYQQQLGTCNK